jgi:4-amino-4-deoxy-L-arabinose transferase-like glycosyltransferase
MMFYRHVRLAETDAWVMLFDTCAIAAIWRGADQPQNASRVAARWFLASGAFIGLAALAKGVPALFALLFLVGLAIERRDGRSFRRLLWRWTISGAPIVAILIGLWWYAYIAHAIGIRTFITELKALRGEDHPASNIDYPPQLLRGLLPWTGFAIAAVVAAVVNWRAERRLRVLLIWCLAILVPLLIAPQKQYHYLMPLYPPLAILIGWLVAEATRPRGDRAAMRTVRVILNLTLVAFALVALVLPVLVRRFGRGDVMSVDLLLAAAILIGGIGIWELKRRRGLEVAMIAFCAFVAVMMPLAQGAWSPTLQPPRARDDAEQLQRLAGGHGSFCFWGDNVSMPLVFELRTIVPKSHSASELNQLASQAPGLLVISISRPGRAALPMPSGWERIAASVDEERTLEVYRAAR